MITGCLLWQHSSAQSITLKQLTSLLNSNPGKLEHHLHKKGFRNPGPIDNATTFTKIKQKKGETAERQFRILTNGATIELEYKTSSRQEYISLQNELKAGSFQYAPTNTTVTDSVLYQRQNFTVLCSAQKIDTAFCYVIKASKRTIPKPRELLFAEDLLQLDSHEYLAAAFGRQNIKTDWFPLSANEAKKCTIIFPNSSRQAIFLWKDGDNQREISFIIIGEQWSSHEKAATTIVLSDWRSRQGIYCGMSLKELQNINQEPINFYNWRTESAGFLAPKNHGQIDFEQLKPVFNCMNCGFLYVDKSQDIIQSSYAIDENQKVYVGSYVVLPEKKTTNGLKQTTSMK